MININEPIAEGTSVLSKYKDSVLFRTECQCTSSEHSVDSYITVARPWDDGDEISVTFYVTAYSKYCDNIWERIKIAARILFLGSDEKEHEILLSNQAALNWAKAVENAVTEISKNEK